MLVAVLPRVAVRVHTVTADDLGVALVPWPVELGDEITVEGDPWPFEIVDLSNSDFVEIRPCGRCRVELAP